MGRSAKSYRTPILGRNGAGEVKARRTAEVRTGKVCTMVGSGEAALIVMAKRLLEDADWVAKQLDSLPHCDFATGDDTRAHALRDVARVASRVHALSGDASDAGDDGDKIDEIEATLIDLADCICGLKSRMIGSYARRAVSEGATKKPKPVPVSTPEQSPIAPNERSKNTTATRN